MALVDGARGKALAIVQPGNWPAENKHTSWTTQNQYTLVHSMIHVGIAPQTNYGAGVIAPVEEIVIVYLNHTWTVTLLTPFGNTLQTEGLVIESMQ